MTASSPDDSSYDNVQSFEEGSSSGGTSNGYMTPVEFAEDEHQLSLDEKMQVCSPVHSS